MLEIMSTPWALHPLPDAVDEWPYIDVASGPAPAAENFAQKFDVAD